jgi:Cysteine-rich CWC
MSDNYACPRCGGGLHCGVADVLPCACTTLTLAAATLARLREHYETCLCVRCLMELAEQEKSRPGLATGRL